MVRKKQSYGDLERAIVALEKKKDEKERMAAIVLKGPALQILKGAGPFL